MFEIAVRNFLLAEQQAHEQVKKVQIKPSFILKLLTCVSGHSWLSQNYEICVIFDFEIYQRPNSQKNAKNSIQAIFRNFTAMHNSSYDPLMTRRFR